MSRRELVLIFLLGFCVGLLLPAPRCHAETPSITLTHAKWQQVVTTLSRRRAKIKQLRASLEAARKKAALERAAYEKRIAALRVLTSKVRKPPKCPRPVAEWIAIGSLALLVAGGAVVIIWQQVRK